MKNWKPKKTDVSTEEIFKWDEILQEISESSDFQEQIRQNRYFQSPQNLNFRDWIKKIW